MGRNQLKRQFSFAKWAFKDSSGRRWYQQVVAQHWSWLDALWYLEMPQFGKLVMASRFSSSSLLGCRLSEDRKQAVGYTSHLQDFEYGGMVDTLHGYTWRDAWTGWLMCTCLPRRANQSCGLKGTWIQTRLLTQTPRWKSNPSLQVKAYPSWKFRSCFLTVAISRRALSSGNSSLPWTLLSEDSWEHGVPETNPLQQWERMYKKLMSQKPHPVGAFFSIQPNLSVHWAIWN